MDELGVGFLFFKQVPNKLQPDPPPCLRRDFASRVRFCAQHPEAPATPRRQRPPRRCPENEPQPTRVAHSPSTHLLSLPTQHYSLSTATAFTTELAQPLFGQGARGGQGHITHPRSNCPPGLLLSLPLVLLFYPLRSTGCHPFGIVMVTPPVLLLSLRPIFLLAPPLGRDSGRPLRFCGRHPSGICVVTPCEPLGRLGLPLGYSAQSGMPLSPPRVL